MFIFSSPRRYWHVAVEVAVEEEGETRCHALSQLWMVVTNQTCVPNVIVTKVLSGWPFTDATHRFCGGSFAPRCKMLSGDWPYFPRC